MNLAQLTKLNEDQARTYLESVRWPDGAVCPHCESQNVCKLQGKSTRPGVHKCRDCRRQFTVTVGTVMADSHIGVREWIIAFHLMTSSKKGFSAHQLHRTLGITYKSAWHMAHRIRHAMQEQPLKAVLGENGIPVECDEKPRKGTGIVSKRGRGTKKTPVKVLVERDGVTRTKVLERMNADNLKAEIRAHVHPTATIMTDENRAYCGIRAEFEGGHKTVNHSEGEYARDGVCTNTAESFFGLVKRQFIGTNHHYSRRHMSRYVAETEFRWNRRKMNDGARREEIIRAIEGKRLTYKQPKNNF